MVPPLTTSRAGLNTRTGVTVAPCAVEPTVMEVNVIAPVTAGASTAAEAVVSALVAMVKPPVVAGRAPPRVSPVRVSDLEAVPVGAEAVVSTIMVLPADAVVAEARVTLAVVMPGVPKK